MTPAKAGPLPGVGRLAGRRAKPGKGPAFAGVIASREGRRDAAGRHGCREQDRKSVV